MHKATLTKHSFADRCVPKLELGNEGARGGSLESRFDIFASLK
jgi:hypothetical protein